MKQLLLRFEVDLNVDETLDDTSSFIESDELGKLTAKVKAAIESAVRAEALDSLSKSKFASFADSLTIDVGTA